MKRNRHAVLSLLIAAAVHPAMSAEAQNEGVVLIDQNAALAGAVTPDDAAGFPVTLSRPGSYRLSGNLTIADPDTTAIEITTDNVTLDLNGFTISGPFDICSGRFQPVWCSQTSA